MNPFGYTQELYEHLKKEIKKLRSIFKESYGNKKIDYTNLYPPRKTDPYKKYLKDTLENEMLVEQLLGSPKFLFEENVYIVINLLDWTWSNTPSFEFLYANQPETITYKELKKMYDEVLQGRYNLYQYNPETGVYKLRNTISSDDKIISSDDFLSLDAKQIKKSEFSRLMNIYFKDIKHEWVHDHKNFRKLPNFEINDVSKNSDYILGGNVPLHTLEDYPFMKTVLVYHWGRVYYHTISYNGYDQGQLICPYTKKLVRWAKLKHCAPIFDIKAKKIC